MQNFLYIVCLHFFFSLFPLSFVSFSLQCLSPNRWRTSVRRLKSNAKSRKLWPGGGRGCRMRRNRRNKHQHTHTHAHTHTLDYIMLLLKGHLGDNQTFLYFVLVSFLGESLVACLCTISKFSVDVLKECSDWTNKYFCFVTLFCCFFFRKCT